MSHGKHCSKSDFGRNRQVIHRFLPNPEPGGRGKFTKNGKGRINTLRHRVRESPLRAQAEEPLGSLCVLPLKETHRYFGLTEAQLMWQRRLWGQNPNASKRGKLTVSL